MSYAPYRGDQTPYESQLIIGREQIEEDLRFLTKYTGCIRTYETSHGLIEVVPIANQLGIKVLLGAWIGDDADKNVREVANAVRLANQYPETVQALIVGNEVLLRGEYSPEGLKRLIQSVRAQVTVPVTYADLWSMWEKYPDVAEVVDFLTIHTLHYWDNSTKPVDEAARDSLAIAKKIAEQHPGKSVFIGEAGWPSTGRMRQEALPSLLNQARYVRQLIVAAGQAGTGLNIIEAFDQPWKRKPEGTVGGFWGVFTTDREVKFPLTGPVRDDPDWKLHFGIAASLGILFTLPIFMTGRRQGASAWFMLAIVSQIAGTCLVLAALQGIDASYNPFQWMVWGGRWLLALAAAALFPIAYLRTIADQPVEPLPMRALIAMIERKQLSAHSRLDLALGAVRALTLFTAAVTMLCFVFDGRHRDFPVAPYAVPALVFVVLATIRQRKQAVDLAEERFLAAVLLFGSVVSPLIEGFGNWQALTWAAVCIVLAAGVQLEARGSGWLGLRSGGRPNEA